MRADDCISRTRAIERLKLNLPISQGADNSRDRHRYMQALADIQAIRELPSVTPQEPKTGHWINTNNLDAKYKAIYMCSNCRSCYTEMKPINMNFCPNCGSDNREVKE